jgi:hypothetical protein
VVNCIRASLSICGGRVAH